jgi:hypothetical protein
LKITKIRVAFLVLIVIASLIFVGFVYWVGLQFASSTPSTIVINGNTYSKRPTPYGYFNFHFANESGPIYAYAYWLLTPDEPRPSGSFVHPPSFVLGGAYIDGLLYSTTPTNFTEFILPPSITSYWAVAAGQPLPINAIVIPSIDGINLGVMLAIMAAVEILLSVAVAFAITLNGKKHIKTNQPIC